MIPLYIFDLDGTLSNLEHRLHHIRPTGNPAWKPDWDAFHSACTADDQIRPVCNLFRKLYSNPFTELWIWTGRMDTVRDQTIKWLNEHVLEMDWCPNLKMRPKGDHRNDDKLKESWLKDLPAADRLRLMMVFEDRSRVVNMWRRNNVACAQVAPGDF